MFDIGFFRSGVQEADKLSQHPPKTNQAGCVPASVLVEIQGSYVRGISKKLKPFQAFLPAPDCYTLKQPRADSSATKLPVNDYILD